jgi:hypothetical protein
MQPRGGQAQIRGNMPIPSDCTTFSHNIKEDGNAIRTNGECPRWMSPQSLFSVINGHLGLSDMNQIMIQWFSGRGDHTIPKIRKLALPKFRIFCFYGSMLLFSLFT